MPPAVAGDYIQAVGEWVPDRVHGEQFKANELRRTRPHTVERIEKYLVSGLVKGIVPQFAQKIVTVFGECTLAGRLGIDRASARRERAALRFML